MSDLAGWLRPLVEARKATAEAAAARSTADWHRNADDYRNDVCDSNGDVVVYDEGTPTEEESAHIAANDPRDVIAQCEADLLTLDEHKHYLANAPDSADNVADFGCGTCHVHPHDGGTCGEGWCRTIRLLAWGYRFRDLAGYASVAGGWAP